MAFATFTPALRRAGIGLLSALALIACATPAADAAGRPLTTGIGHLDSIDPAAFAKVRNAGGSIVFDRVRWEVIAPKQEPVAWNPADPGDPNYEWENLDLLVTRAVAAGLTPVLQIFGAPRWAERCQRMLSGESVCDPDPADLAAFSRAVVERYSGRYQGLPHVRYWEVLNEPNLTLYLEPQYRDGKLVSPDIYRNLQNTFYDTVKSVDPSNLVLGPGLGPIAVPKFTVGPMRFTRALLCMKGTRKPRPIKGNCHGGLKLDIFDIHPFTTGRPTHEGGINDVQMGDLGKLQRLLRAADKAGRIKGAYKRTPLWITEFSYDSNPPDPGGLPMKIEQQWVSEALYQAWIHHVPVFLWYSLTDREHNPDVPYSQSLESGLYFWAANVAAAEPKPAMHSFRFPFVVFREGKGLSFWGRTPTSGRGRVVLQVRRGGKWKRLRRVKANKAGIFRGFARSGYGKRKRKGEEVRAVYAGEASNGFPIRRVRDFAQPPFGG